MATPIKILTTDDIDCLVAKEIFARGFGTHPRVRTEPIRWVAVRGGGYHDWAIYRGPLEWDEDMIRRQGDKIMSDDVIRYLVPCDDAALQNYRK